MEQLELFTNESNRNVINKRITTVRKIDFKFKQDIDLINPILYLKDFPQSNYCFITKFNRFYYIDEVKLLKGGIYEIFLSVDVLMSFKDSILASDYYNVDGVLRITENTIDFNDVYNPEKFLLIVGVRNG